MLLIAHNARLSVVASRIRLGQYVAVINYARYVMPTVDVLVQANSFAEIGVRQAELRNAN